MSDATNDFGSNSAPAARPPAPPAPPAVAGLGPTAAIAGIIGLIFLMIGMTFGRWLIATFTHQPFETGMNWNDGRPVAYFDMELGAAWRDFGQFLTGVALLIEAVLYGVAVVVPTLSRKMIAVVLSVAILGCVANIISAAMQMKAGFNAPLFALIGLAICAISAFSARQHLQDRLPRRGNGL